MTALQLQNNRESPSRNYFTKFHRLFQVVMLIGILKAGLLSAAFAQRENGIIIDAGDYTPIPFAAITPVNNPLKGVMADVRGRVRIPPAAFSQQLNVSHVGYKPVVIPADYFLAHDTLMLQPRTRELQEVTVLAGENPANRIVQKVIANRPKHHPGQIPAYQCALYTKTRFGFVPNRKKLSDSMYQAHKRKADSTNFFLMETVADRYYKAPGRVKQHVKGLRTSGLDNPGFSILPTDFQPFHVYQDYLHIYEMDYLSPLARGATRKYFFQLQDTLYENRDSIFIIDFQPKAGKNFTGLKGHLYVHTDGYALQNIEAETHDEALLHMRINQEYRRVQDERWFPAAIDFELLYPEYPSKETGMHVESYSHIRNVSFSLPESNIQFNSVTQTLDEEAEQRDSLFWQTHRAVPLEPIDVTTYQHIDSVFEANNVQKVYDLFAEVTTSGYIPVSVLGVKPIWLYNAYEEHHLGLGLSTRETLMPHVNLSGYAAYGTGDQTWKYGGALRFEALPNDRFQLAFRYDQTLREPGSYSIAFDKRPSYRERYLTSRMQPVMRYQMEANWKLKFWKFGVSAESSALWGDQTWMNGSTDPMHLTTYGTHVKFAPGEKQSPFFGTMITIEQSLPVLYLNYTRGSDKIAGGEFDFHRLTASVSHNLLIRHLGTFSYRLEGGLINGEFPPSWFFGMPGGKDKNFPVPVPETFHTMPRYTFFADRFVNVFLRHNFGARLLKTDWFSPDISLVHHMSYGELKETHPEIKGLDVPEKGYFESGLRLDNLLKFNYINFAYLGVGGGVFYRYGPYAATKPSQNVTLKASISLTFNK